MIIIKLIEKIQSMLIKSDTLYSNTVMFMLSIVLHQCYIYVHTKAARNM